MNRLLTVSARGVLVIPADIRRRWTGTSVMLTERHGELVLTPIPAGPAASVRGALSHVVHESASFDEERAASRREDE